MTPKATTRSIRPTSRNATALDVLSGIIRFAARRIRERVAPVRLEEASDLSHIRTLMREHWRAAGHEDATIEYFMRDAFDYRGYIDVVERAQRLWGRLEGRKVLDLGCGWGSLSLALSAAGAAVTYVDMEPRHVEVATLRVPKGSGFVGDARLLTATGKLPAGSFDHIFAHAVIEHVGNDPDQRGPAGAALAAKRSMMRQLAQHLRPGGTAFVSTGNYAFPLDGEVKTWFFHWLPAAEQRPILEAMGIGADNYGLLTWSELAGLFADADLLVDAVESGDPGPYELLLRVLSLLVGHARTKHRLSLFQIERMRELMQNDPHFMPTWYAFVRRPESSSSIDR